MMNPDFKDAILILSKLLNKNQIKWALIGSANLQLQGVNIEPNDIDIVVLVNDLEKMQKIFLNYSPSALKTLMPLSEFDTKKIELTFIINTILVQTIGETPHSLYARQMLSDNLVKIKINNVEIPCFSLAIEAELYAKTNRKQKSKLILDFLRTKKTE
jgi:hypothetical protein